MNEQNHIIQRQVVDLTLRTDSVTGRRVQQAVSDLYRASILRLIESTFNRLAESDRVISIGRLVIDIGEVDINRLEDQFPERVESQLLRILNDQLIALRLKGEMNALGITTALPGDSDVAVRSLAESRIRSLAHFLRTGQLPWNASVTGKSKPFVQLLEELLGEERTLTVGMLSEQLAHRARLHRFIFQIPDRKLLKLLPICANPGDHKPSVERAIRYLSVFASGLVAAALNMGHRIPAGKHALRIRIWSRIVRIVLHEPNGISLSGRWLSKQILDSIEDLPWNSDPGTSNIGQGTDIAINETLSRLVSRLMNDGERGYTGDVTALLRTYSQFRHNAESGKSEAPGTVTDPAVPERSSEDKPEDRETAGLRHGEMSHNEIEKPHEQAMPEENSGVPETDREATGSGTGNENDNSSKSPETETFMKERRQRRRNRSQASPDGSDFGARDDGDSVTASGSAPLPKRATRPSEDIWVRNAGLVLLHPMVLSLFERTNLVADRQFLTDEARQRGVHLLQFLVTRKQETPEEELLLNKIMCGLDPLTPLIPGIEITPAEEKECTALLKTLIARWEVLKNSSPEAVRTTFLQRDGMVGKEGISGGWKVTVERNSFDVLLDRLPWGISMFKMPWSSYLIHVEW